MENENLPGTTRVEAFSDGVMAVAITILVLEIKLPHLNSDVSDTDALLAMKALLPQIFTFILSFVMLAIFWVNHHQFMHSISSVNRSVLWLNNHLLFWLCLIPFPTAFLGDQPFLKTAVGLFAACMFCAAVSFFLLRWYALTKSQLTHQHISNDYIKTSLRKSAIAPILYAISIAGAFISVYISYAIFIAVPLLFFLPQKHK